MSIGITLALLAAIGYGTADFVGGAGARRAPTMSIVFIGQLTGAAAMLGIDPGSILGKAAPRSPVYLSTMPRPDAGGGTRTPDTRIMIRQHTWALGRIWLSRAVFGGVRGRSGAQVRDHFGTTLV